MTRFLQDLYAGESSTWSSFLRKVAKTPATAVLNALGILKNKLGTPKERICFSPQRYILVSALTATRRRGF